MAFGDRLKQLRKRKNLTQQQLANRFDISASTIGMYEQNRREPDFETLETIADFFNVDMDYLTGRSEIENKYSVVKDGLIPEGFEPPPEMKLKPLVGSIACGTPILAEQNIEDYIEVPKNIRCDFLLTCKGDSMIDAGIQDGDSVYIIKQPDIDYNGQIAAIRINGEATLKKMYKYEKKVVLQPANSEYEPLVYTQEEINNITVEGIATGFTHKFNNR